MGFEPGSFVGFDDADLGGLVERLIDLIEHGFGFLGQTSDYELVELFNRIFIAINPL